MYKPSQTNINFYKWRPILAKIVSLEEMQTFWSLNDLADANEALDLQADSDAFQSREATKGRR